MRKIGGTSCLNIVKKAFRSPVKDNNEKKSSKRREEQEHEEEVEKNRGNRRWIFQKPNVTTIYHDEARNVTPALNPSACVFRRNLAKNPSPEDADAEQQCAIAVAMAIGVAAEAAVATARAAAEIIRLTRPSSSVREQRAATLIQTAFRGYLARRALQALKGIVKLQALVRGHNVRKQAKMTFQCMQALIRVQAQVCSQRKRLSSRGSLVSIPRRNSCIRGSHASSKKFISRNGNTSDDGNDYQYTPKKLHYLHQETKEAATKCEISLAQAFTQQMWRPDKDHISANTEDYEENPRYFDRKTTNQNEAISKISCDERDCIKIVEIDSIQPCSFSNHNFWRSQTHDYQEQQQRLSSYTASSPLQRFHQNFSVQSNITRCFPRIKPPGVHATSPTAVRTPTCSSLFHQGNACGDSIPASGPKYMAATASANARAQSHSAPRHRAYTPDGERKGVAKKRLSFPVPDPILNDMCASNLRSSRNPSCKRMNNHVQDEQRSSVSSPCTCSLGCMISSPSDGDSRR